MNDERKGSLKKLIKKKHAKMSDSSQRKLECGLCFLPQGAERRNNHQGDQIPYRNIWKLVRKNCICIVWLNGLISS